MTGWAQPPYKREEQKSETETKIMSLFTHPNFVELVDLIHYKTHFSLMTILSIFLALKRLRGNSLEAGQCCSFPSMPRIPLQPRPRPWGPPHEVAVVTG